MKVSVIIPTYRRSSIVVERAIDSIFADPAFIESVDSIVVIDQNEPVLEFSSNSKRFGYEKISHKSEIVNNIKSKLIHIYGISPSVTKAKNIGSKYVSSDLFVFFDDDVELFPNCISTYIELFKKYPEASYFGGRETVADYIPRESVIKKIFRKVANLQSEPLYQYNGVYIGRIKPNSYMIKNFDVPANRLIRIDGARGCNWATKREFFLKAGGFDETYQGSALREETDLYIRLNAFGPAYYASDARVTHYRQVGGCDNLSDSLKSLKSKLDNELYFQKKNFPNCSRIHFMVRLIPLMLENLSSSKGLSLYFWLIYALKI
jgi:GT2 family glycosyltransferase